MRRLATLSVVAAIAAAGFGILLQAGIPQVPTGTWAPAGFLADARMDSETALLDDGRVLIIGGTGLTGALATVELFDTEGSWWLAAPMAVARTGHTATALADGRVLVTGGQNADGVTADAELYYPASDAWVAVPNMVEARAGHTATLLDDGRVLIAGGSSEPSFSVEIFDPATDSFTFAGSSPLVRTDHAAALLGDGRVLIAGGWSGGAATGAADIYDPAIGLLTPTTDLQVARIGHSATALIGGQVLIVGGRDGVTDLSSVEVFDPATETFAVVGSALAVARSGHRAFSLPNNNNVLVVGGRAAGVPLASAELFTPWTGALSATNAMGAARAGLTGSAVGQDGMLLVAGGATSESLHVSSELYGFATVKTDKDDYAPGQTVVITGGGWQPGETVTLLLQEYVSPAFHDDLVLTATADENGNILNTEFFPLQHDIGVRFYLTGTGQTTGWSAQTTFTDGPPKISLEQCRNGAAVSPNACSDLGGSVGWVNGNAGASQAHLLEGFSIPYRAVMENLPTGTDITVVFGYDIKHGGKHALDYLTHFARLDPHLVNFGHGPEMVTPKSGVSGISATTMTFPIPAPSSVSSCASDVGDQPATSFNALPAGQRLMTLFGGTITNVLYDGAQGCLTDAQAETQIAVSFTVVNPTAVLAWGGHIAKATDWGPGNSAGAISGSPFHMRLISWSLGNLGHQDRSLSAGAVISPGAITIVKDATPVGSTSFSFTGSPVPLTNFSLVDDGSATDTKVFSDITNFTTYTVTENTPPGWDLTGIGCVVAGENGGSQDINGATVTIDLKEGENVTCTFANTQQQGDLIVIKHVINDDGGTAVAADWTMDITGTNVSSTGFAGEEAPGVTVTLDAGAYSVDESGDPSGYTKSLSADCSGTIAAGETKTCTITNDDVAPTLKLVKEVINLDGGDAGPDDWTLTAISTGGDATRDISTLGGSGGFETVFANAVYDLAESPDPLTGYTTGSFSCVGGTQSGSTITLAEGETGVICTITNDDVAPTLKLVKEVINLDGGDAGPDDWTLTAISTGGDATRDISTLGGSGVFETVFANVGYDLSETGLAGYTAGSFSCVGGTLVGSTVTLTEGETGVVCTITNDDIPGTLIIQKVAVGIGLQTAEFDFEISPPVGAQFTETISVSGGGVQGQAAFTLSGLALGAPPHTVTELALPVNWVFTSLNCSLTGSGAGTSTFSTSGQTATVTLVGAGDTVTCVYTNTHVATRATQGFWSTHLNVMSNGQSLMNIISAIGLQLCGNGSLVGAGDTVTCVYTNTHVATRATQGFWSTHLNVMSNGQSLMNIISAIGLQLCGNPARVVDMVPELMGGFWSRISRTAGPPKGTRRNPLDQARMQLIQQLLAAVLNNHVFGADDEGAITAGERSAYCGTNRRGAIIMAADALATFNESGGSAPFPDGFEQGSADPKTARSIADRPFWDMLP